MTEVTLIASNGPFGPTPAACGFFLVLLGGPFVLVALTARSLLSAELLSAPALGAMVLVAAALLYFLWPVVATDQRVASAPVWRTAAVAAVGSLSVTLLREGWKRGSLHRR